MADLAVEEERARLMKEVVYRAKKLLLTNFEHILATWLSVNCITFKLNIKFITNEYHKESDILYTMVIE